MSLPKNALIKVIKKEFQGQYNQWLDKEASDTMRRNLEPGDSSINRNISIEQIREIEKYLGRECEDIRTIWRGVELFRDGSEWGDILSLPDADLKWISVNIEQLLALPEDFIIFLDFLSLLNEAGIEEFLYNVNYLKRSVMDGIEINIENTMEKYFLLSNIAEQRTWFEDFEKIWQYIKKIRK